MKKWTVDTFIINKDGGSFTVMNQLCFLMVLSSVLRFPHSVGSTGHMKKSLSKYLMQENHLMLKRHPKISAHPSPKHPLKLPVLEIYGNTQGKQIIASLGKLLHFQKGQKSTSAPR